MSKELATIDYNSKEVVDTLIATVAQGLNKQEFSLFAEHCKSTGLNPFKKEVWAIKANNRLQLMTGINGYFTIANRHPEFDGYEEGFVGKDGQELPDTYQGSDYIGAWCRVHRKDRKIPAKGVAFKNEYEKNYGNWKTMPKSMLLKCAESIALRKAFPQELNGTYTAEEMPVEYSQTVEVVQPKPILQSLKTADQIAEEMPAMQTQHSESDKLGFGKYKDLTWAEVNQDYLEWLIGKHDTRISPRALAEVERRALVQTIPDCWKDDNIPAFEDEEVAA